MYACVCVCLCVGVCMYMYVWVHVCMCKYLCVCVFVSLFMNAVNSRFTRKLLTILNDYKEYRCSEESLNIGWNKDVHRIMPLQPYICANFVCVCMHACVLQRQFV